MEKFALIPFVALLVSAAFGAVSIAWDSERRATRSMAGLFACTGLWALVDLLTYMETEPDRALAWMRWAHLGLLMMGPSALWILAQLLPQARERLSRQARVAAVVCFVLGVGVAFVPGSVEAMIPTVYGGWMPRYGLASIMIILASTLIPVYAALVASRIPGRARPARVDPRRVWALRLCVGFSGLVVVPTELLAPLLEIPFPRLGALTVSSAAAVMWLRVLHEADDLAVTPQGLARSLLAELHDGIALIALDGRILSTNLRLAQLSGRVGSELLGQPLANLVDAPSEEICMGLEDREAVLHPIDGGHIPVSLSSSIVRNRSGGAIGVVVVVRDLREVDALRSQLLTSGRLAAIGELAAGIAHEVNNPVAFIRSDLNLLCERIAELRDRVAARENLDHEVAHFDRGLRRARNALEGIERVAEVVGDVREFAHVGGAGQGGSDPESVVEGAMRLARLERAEDVELRIVSASCSQRIDSGQELKQVLLTLLRVLAQGADKGGRVDIDLGSDTRDLVVGMTVEPLEDSSAELLSRFDVVGGDLMPGSHAEFGLRIAGDLIEQLGGGLMVEASGPKAIRLEISIPLEAREMSN